MVERSTTSSMKAMWCGCVTWSGNALMPCPPSRATPSLCLAIISRSQHTDPSSHAHARTSTDEKSHTNFVWDGKTSMNVLNRSSITHRPTSVNLGTGCARDARYEKINNLGSNVKEGIT